MEPVHEMHILYTRQLREDKSYKKKVDEKKKS